MSLATSVLSRDAFFKGSLFHFCAPGGESIYLPVAALQTWIQSSCNVEYFVVIFVLARTLTGDVRATLFFSVLCVTGQTDETAMHV